MLIDALLSSYKIALSLFFTSSLFDALFYSMNCVTNAYEFKLLIYYGLYKIELWNIAIIKYFITNSNIPYGPMLMGVKMILLLLCLMNDRRFSDFSVKQNSLI